MKNRQTRRLPGYNYSSPGAYFVTICVQNRECFFGEIVNGKFLSNDAGRMVEKWWVKLPEKYPCVQCDEYVIMPNHFHGILFILAPTVGAIPCNRPVIPCNRPVGNVDKDSIYGLGENMVSPLRGLGRYLSWFKRMTTNNYIRGVKKCGWPGFDGRLWQRNYYEHIIRNEIELNNIRQYIKNNPIKWQNDNYYVLNKR